ncbi:hypothetical protein [Nocardia brasiliensis]
MLFRLIFLLALLPAAAFTVLLIALTSTTSMLAEGYADLRGQCTNAIGPDPSETATVTRSVHVDTRPPPRSAPATSPTANPYASLTIPPTAEVSEWLGECAAAVRVADYRGPMLQIQNSGRTVDCAGWLALAALERSAAAGEADVSADAAAFLQWVTYFASLADGPAGCHYPATGAPGARVVPEAVDATRRGCALPADPSGRRPAAVVLPDRIVDQALCGQPVQRAAMSTGDLVFWEFQRYKPLRAGIAVDATTVVAVDPAVGRIVRVSLAPSTVIGVKRVLEGGDG